MTQCIITLPINADTLNWALTHYPTQQVTQFSERRNQYLHLSRAMLRHLLSKHFGIDALPSIAYGEHGKPYFQAVPHIHFNISHTDHMMAIVITDMGCVGIDIERIKTRRNFSGLAERVFTAHERAYLAAATNYQQCFFQLWSAKEAYLKATGTGLSGLAGLSLDLIQNRAYGALEKGTLYLAQDADKMSFALYLPEKTAPIVHYFDGQTFTLEHISWHALMCSHH